MKRSRKRLFAIVATALIIVVAAGGWFLWRHPLSVSARSEWAIGIYTGMSPFELYDPEDIVNPVITADAVTDVKADFVADPFLLLHQGRWYMFFEVLNSLTGQGDIGVAVSDDARHWGYQQIVLDEPFHLSYPFVFEHEGEIYMIPESAAGHRLSAYRAVDFPIQWEYAWTLVEGDFGDHELFVKDGIWWLLAGAEPARHDSLKLFFAPDLRGPWVEHPMSPVVVDNANIARPGGRPLVLKGRIFRFAQDCAPTYGRALNAFEITELTTTTYLERPGWPRPVLGPGRVSWNRHGMHHLDAQRVDGDDWIAAVDGYRKKLVFMIEY